MGDIREYQVLGDKRQAGDGSPGKAGPSRSSRKPRLEGIPNRGTTNMMKAGKGGGLPNRQTNALLRQPPRESVSNRHDATPQPNTRESSRPTLIYFTEGEQVVVAIKPPGNEPEAIEQAFDEAGACSCPGSWTEVSSSDRTWPLFYSLHLDQTGRHSEIGWDELERLAGTVLREGKTGETADHPRGPNEATVTPAAAAAGGLQPGPWSPPGEQPIPFYIGNKAHEMIAEAYEATHPGELIFANSIPLQTIIDRLADSIEGLDPQALAEYAALRPDILNATRRHLYEIKQERAAAAGQSEALMYVAALARAGLVITLGPVAEPGTTGVLPAPGGFFSFRCALPGVIVYQYSKKNPQEQEQEEEKRVPVRSPEFDPRRVFEQGYLASLSGAALAMAIVYLIVSEGSRLVPARNLVPVP